MYLNFFGLKEQPFGVTPDPRFLHLSPAHREAIASLYYGIESGRGFLALIAKPGMGKTTILFHLLEKFRSTARTAFIFQTQCTSREFMRFLLAELGHEGDTQDFVRMNEEFNKRLLQEARAGNRFIVVVDEAQNLDASVLETVRLLSDFETPRAKLLTIILAGQPELAGKLASPSLSQLRQRISIVNRLEPLPVWEVKDYIEHRLKVAGYEGQPIFTAEALERIAQFTDGIPRNVNNFCFNALSLACALRHKTVDLSVVEEVISDLDITKHLVDLNTPPGEASAVVNDKPHVEKPAVISERPRIEKLDVISDRRPVEAPEGLNDKPHVEAPTAMSDRPQVEKLGGISDRPSVDAPRVVTGKPHLEKSTAINDKPEVEKLTVSGPQPEASPVPVPDKKPVTSVSAPAPVRTTRSENFSFAEAQAYMEEIARRLKGLTTTEIEAARSRGPGQD